MTKDDKFNAWTAQRMEEFDDGSKTFTVNELMVLSSRQYNTLRQRGQWMEPSPQKREIIALKAQLEQLKKATSTKKKTQPSPAPTTKDGTNSKKEGEKKKYEKAAWMTKAPTEGQPKEKTVNDKKYYWCPTHNAWVRHKPSECKGKGYKPPKGKGNSTAPTAEHLQATLANLEAKE